MERRRRAWGSDACLRRECAPSTRVGRRCPCPASISSASKGARCRMGQGQVLVANPEILGPEPFRAGPLRFAAVNLLIGIFPATPLAPWCILAVPGPPVHESFCPPPPPSPSSPADLTRRPLAAAGAGPAGVVERRRVAGVGAAAHDAARPGHGRRRHGLRLRRHSQGVAGERAPVTCAGGWEAAAHGRPGGALRAGPAGQ